MRIPSGQALAALLAAAGAAAPGPMAASDASGQAAGVPTFPSAAELVQIDVVVTGPGGTPVRDLGREDFQVLEDGRPQVISHFAVGTASRPAALPVARSTAGAMPGARTPPAAVVNGRAIVLVFDDLHLGPGRLTAAKREAIRFLQEEVGLRDLTALVTTSGVRGVFQPLTRDRGAVVRAIEQVSVQDRSARTRQGSPYISEQQAEESSSSRGTWPSAWSRSG